MCSILKKKKKNTLREIYLADFFWTDLLKKRFHCLETFCRDSQLLPERQEASDGHVHSRVFVPGLLGDLARYVTCATRGLEVACSVLSNNSTNNGEREPHQHPGTKQQKHGGGRQGLSRSTPPVNRVHHTPGEKERG